MITKKLQRVIHVLEDGRRKYVTHHGLLEKWNDTEVQLLINNHQKYGCAAYLADFSKYAVCYYDLRKRFPTAKIIKVVGIEFENHDLPLNKNIIF